MDLLYKSLLYLTGWPLAVVLFAGGLYFTIRTGLIQAFLKESINVTKEKPKTGKISSFSALMVSTASRVGSGNIIGVSVAICSGGPGAVFWMWLTATIGGASAFVESTLAQIFKRKKPDGTSYGGPAYYIESTLKSKFLAIVFTLALIFTYGVGYNMLASYNLQSAFSEFEFYKETANIVWYFGIGVALLFFICVCGGCKSIIKVTSVLVPFMGVAYILFALVSVIINIEQIPGERAAAVLMQKDQQFYPNEAYELPLYGNQWIPLGVKTTLDTKIKLSAILDKACNGGSIAHINLDAPLTDFDTAWKLLNYISDRGVTYFAFNLRISACANNHGFYGKTCPICGKPSVTTYQRIVGFLTPEKTYSKERKAEFGMRDWMNTESFSEL